MNMDGWLITPEAAAFLNIPVSSFYLLAQVRERLSYVPRPHRLQGYGNKQFYKRDALVIFRDFYGDGLGDELRRALSENRKQVNHCHVPLLNQQFVRGDFSHARRS
jgi:hypothetical protein